MRQSLYIRILGILVMPLLASHLLAQSQAPARASAPAHNPDDPVTVTLPDRATLPSSPGYFCFDANVTVGQSNFPMTFGLFLPATYFASKDPFPIVITFHNHGIEGRGGQGLTDEGLPALWVSDKWDNRDSEQRTSISELTVRKTAMYIGIAPQCPKGWFFARPPMPQVISELTTQIAKAYRTDPERTYLTGFSRGGTSCWLLAEQMPHRYAAIAPISSGRTPDPTQTVQTLRFLPIYLACGTNDKFGGQCQDMNAALEQSQHPDYVYRPVAQGTHWCYPTVYNDPEFWHWLFTKRSEAEDAVNADAMQLNPQATAPNPSPANLPIGSSTFPRVARQ